jgi:hypothetical protein
LATDVSRHTKTQNIIVNLPSLRLTFPKANLLQMRQKAASELWKVKVPLKDLALESEAPLMRILPLPRTVQMRSCKHSG